MRLVGLVLAALLLALGPAEALAPSNLELVTDTARQAVDEALAGLDIGDSVSTIGLQAAAAHPANWLVEHLISEALLERGLTLGAGDAADQDLRIDMRVIDLSVDGRSSLLGGAVKRRCRVVLRLDVYREGEQLDSGEGHVERVDSIPKNQLEALQHSRFSFAKTDLEKRSWGKYVEPIIITTVLGSLVYLFFSNR